MNVSDIAYAIDCEGKFYSVFPIWIGAYFGDADTAVTDLGLGE